MSTQAQDRELFKKEIFVHGRDTLKYRILYPTQYDINKKYPVVLFLHGAGERGNDNEKQLVHGSGLFLDSVNRSQFPTFVIFPQCPQNSYWAKMKRELNGEADSLGNFMFTSTGEPNKPLALVQQLIDSFVQTPQVNADQVYIGGLSMGGMGTFEMLWRRPGLFAAAFAICGGGDPKKVTEYAQGFPIWVFHGDNDKVVPVSNSRLMVNSLKAAGAKVTYTEYPGVGHDSWNNAFKEPALLDWLFEQKRRQETLNADK